MGLIDKLTAIGNAIRSKTGKTDTLTLDQMAEEIAGISGGLDNTLATYEQQNAQLTAFLAEAGSKYTDDNYASVSVASSYVGQFDDPNGYTLTLKSSGTLWVTDETEQQYSYKETVTQGPYTFYDLIPAHVYRWILIDGNGDVAQSGRITSTGKVRMIYDAYAEAGSTDNMRDIGGWTCDGGTVRYGIIYRGQIPRALKAETKAKMRDVFRIKNQIDMYAETKYAIYDGVNYSAYLLSDSGGKSNVEIGNKYYKLAAQALREAMKNAAGASPTYIHCWSGADRTGTLCWMLLALLGVSEADCDKDYELTGLAGRKNRYRTTNNALPTYFLTLGSTINEGVIKWCQKVGITEKEVNEYRQAMSTGTPAVITYSWSVTNTLTNITTSNSSTAVSGSYTATLSPASGYDLGAVTVTMGGEDIAVSAYNSTTGVITISNVTGDITITAEGQKQATAYTNLLDTVGYQNGKYASEPMGNFGTDAAYWCTGVIKWDKPKSEYLYIKGWTYSTSASHSRIYGSDSASGGINSTYGYCSSSRLSTHYSVETLSSGYVRIKALTGSDTTRYVMISQPGTGGGAIITMNEPIE